MITLGQASNYSADQVWRQLFAWGTRRDSEQLKAALAQRYRVPVAQVALYHTGRSALTAALQAVAPDGGKNVIIPGLTCIAVVRAVKAAGCRPVFVDIKRENLEYNYEKLEETLTQLIKESQKNAEKSNESKKSTKLQKIADREKVPDSPSSDASGNSFRQKAIESAKIASGEKETFSLEQHGRQDHLQNSLDNSCDLCYNGSIILVQNTLGIPWEVAKIEKIAKKHQALIVEDLAHSAGRIYPDGREVGMVGAASALSFGKGKAIDTISGGAVIVREGQMPTIPAKKPRLSDRWRDRWYPIFGSMARGLWRCGIGKVLIGGLVKIHFVQRSADAELNLEHRLTHWQARLALKQLQNLPQTPLRDYKLIQNRKQALQKLEQNGYCLQEIWYDTPVSPARYAKEADFPAKACPETVKIAAEIVNLPTWYAPEKLVKAYEIIKEYEEDA